MEKSWDQQLWVLSTVGGKQEKIGGGKDIMSKFGATIAISMLYKHRYIEICASRRA